MSNLQSGDPVYSEKHGGKGKILSVNREDGYAMYAIEWPGGIQTHPPHEADNFFRAEAIRCFPPKEEVEQ